uniref:Uncharacterized protein n=1 Tax=Arundo donax TaxID=35708 RepID=A0A0A9E976_ARUDO
MEWTWNNQWMTLICQTGKQIGSRNPLAWSSSIQIRMKQIHGASKLISNCCLLTASSGTPTLVLNLVTWKISSSLSHFLIEGNLNLWELGLAIWGTHAS